MPSKLGPHSLAPTAASLNLVQAGCRLVKLVDDFGPAAEYLAINPNLIIIGRAYSAYTLLEQYHQGLTPAAAAAAFVNDQYQRVYRHNPLIKLWEGHNEPSFGGPNDAGALEKMAWYGEYEAQRLRLLADLGLRGVVGNFSTGYPEVYSDNRMWEAFLPAMVAAKQRAGYLGVHEYSAPFVWWMTGRYQPSNCDGVIREHLGDRGWLTLRYRHYYEDVFRPRGLGDVPLVITEAGADAVGHNCPGAPSGAWKDLRNYWESYDGRDDPIGYWRDTPPAQRNAERYYAEQLIWYDSELRRDSFVVGATVFTFGTNSPTWNNYDVNHTLVPTVLADHIRRVRHDPDPSDDDGSGVGDPPDELDGEGDDRGKDELPDDDPAPTSKRGWPRVQYRRLYLLLPPALDDPAWIEAMARAVWETQRPTIGGSADDAGIGNLHARAVLAINPAEWGATPPLAAWLNQHYPGVHYAEMVTRTPDQLRILLESARLPAPALVSDAPPQVELGRPRAEYARRYVLFNPTQRDPEWVIAAARATWRDFRFTYGGSADDAGIGALKDRTVLAVNPHDGWPTDLQAWFAQHYPGVHYRPVYGSTPQAVAAQLRQAAAAFVRN